LLAGEFLRLAAQHPELELGGLATREPGEDLSRLQPHLGASCVSLSVAGTTEALREHLNDPAERAVLVLALPHGETAPLWSALRAALGARAERLLVLDLSADYRLRAAGLHRRWYGQSHPDADELERFAYGLPELGREAIRRATRVAAPGCFATAMQLACLPAARAGVLDAARPWVLSAVTGSSGSGAKPLPGTHHPHRHANLWAYGLAGHRHEAELLQALAPLGLAPALAFVPHSGPFVRGIHLTAVLPLARALELDEARALFTQAYAGEPFVEVLAEGAPDLRRVVGSNRAALGVATKPQTLIVLCTLDNLVKGGAGQALQALNLMLGLEESTGLPRAGLGVT
jgi:N-acetyl-gamma-glutamyl-phosphate reductase